MAAPKADLERLYLDEKRSTRQIGEHYGVAHITVRRWLMKFGIALRPSGSGLEHEGRPKPSCDELRSLIQDQDMTYAEVAAIYGVDMTAIPQWLDRCGLPRRCRPVLLTADEARTRYEAGESATAIAEAAGLKSKTSVLNLLHQAGVAMRDAGWRDQIVGTDGTLVRSTFELHVANWLHENGISYEYEPKIPFGHQRCRADFLVNGWYVEIWGVHSVASYKTKKELKRREYARLGLPLVELSPHHFSRDRHILQARLNNLRCLPDRSHR